MRRVLVFFAGLASATCLDPTEVRLTIQTNICDLREVAVFLEGTSAPSATTTLTQDPSCDPSKMRKAGTVVFIPSTGGGSKARFGFKVEGTLTGGSCDGAMKSKCVVATRRSAGYIDHTRLDLPVDLTRDCVDVTCADNQTCVSGRCVSADVACGGKTCELADASVDAPVVDAPVEAQPPWCVEQPFQLYPGVKPLDYWTFDDPDTTLFLDQGINTQSTMRDQAVRVPGFCGQGIAPINAAQVMTPKYQQVGFGIYAHVLVKSASALGTVFTRKDLVNSLRLDVAQGFFALKLNGTDYWKGGADPKWHVIELQWTVNATRVVLDQQNIMPITNGTGLVAPADVMFGPATDVVVDEVRTFAQQ